MKELMTEVARELGDGWSYVHNPHDYFYDTFGRLESPDASIDVRVIAYGSNAGRLEMFTSYTGIPDYTSQDCPSGLRQQITVSQDRTAKAIAADMTRRLLPQAAEETATARRNIAQRIERTRYTQSLAESLATLVGVDPDRVRPENNGASHHFSLPYNAGPFGRVQCGMSSVSIHLDNLSPDQARTVLNALYS